MNQLLDDLEEGEKTNMRIKIDGTTYNFTVKVETISNNLESVTCKILECEYLNDNWAGRVIIINRAGKVHDFDNRIGELIEYKV